MIQLEHVSVGYGSHPVLEDLNLQLEPGRFYAILGKNGCGKSTLLKSILGLLPVQSGQIWIEGRKLEDYSRKELACKLSLLKQNHAPADLSVLRMVLHGRFCRHTWPARYDETDIQLAKEALQEAGYTGDLHTHLPELSGGQQQKVYLALCLCQEADSMFFDEPSTYLDASSQYALMEQLKSQARQGHCVTAVLHDLSMALQYADTILLLDQGKLAFAGTPEEFMDRHLAEIIFHVRLHRFESDGRFWYAQSPLF